MCYNDYSMEVFQLAVDRAAHLTVGATITTDVCASAQERHQLSSVSCVALGRLLTSAVLAALVERKRGGLSLQVICEGRLGQLFADVTDEGDLRGYVKNADFELPAVAGADTRWMVGVAVGSGLLSVIRLGEGREFTQSTTELISGELDADVEHFLSKSVQTPTALVCDVLLDEAGRVRRAGGLIVQAMPDAEAAALSALSPGFPGVDFPKLLRTAQTPADLVRAVFPQAELIDTTRVRWQCRCSHQRVVGALQMLSAEDLAQMVDSKEDASVSCDFCGRAYRVDAAEVERLFLETITARG